MTRANPYPLLITTEHANKPRFVAAVAATTQPFVDIQETLLGLISDFDLDLAIGVQLDQVGQWVGQSRRIQTALVGVYFSWGVVGVGWGQGVWKGEFDPSTGLVTLNDDYYRLLLRAVISLNSWDGTTPKAAAALAPLFPLNAVYIQDNFDMSISVVISGPAVDPVAAALLTGGYLALRAAAVGVRYYFPSTSASPVFGWGADNDFIGGWGVGSWGQSTPAAPSQDIITETGAGLTTEGGTQIIT
jgi:hypothetical protein